jgi:hypothetical protein
MRLRAGGECLDGDRRTLRAEAMVGHWVEEKAHFTRGTFPRVSRTGAWTDVGHYTQIVWRDTSESAAPSRGAAYGMCWSAATPGRATWWAKRPSDPCAPAELLRAGGNCTRGGTLLFW